MEKKELFCNGNRIFMHLDYSAGLTKRRRPFDPVRQRFWKLKLNPQEFSLKVWRMIIWIQTIFNDGKRDQPYWRQRGRETMSVMERQKEKGLSVCKEKLSGTVCCDVLGSQTDRQTIELDLPWRGDVSAPLTSSAGDCLLPWRPCPSANPRAPGTLPQTPADWRQRERERLLSGIIVVIQFSFLCYSYCVPYMFYFLLLFLVLL